MEHRQYRTRHSCRGPCGQLCVAAQVCIVTNDDNYLEYKAWIERWGGDWGISVDDIYNTGRTIDDPRTGTLVDLAWLIDLCGLHHNTLVVAEAHSIFDPKFNLVRVIEYAQVRGLDCVAYHTPYDGEWESSGNRPVRALLCSAHRARASRQARPPHRQHAVFTNPKALKESTDLCIQPLVVCCQHRRSLTWQLLVPLLWAKAQHPSDCQKIVHAQRVIIIWGLKISSACHVRQVVVLAIAFKCAILLLIRTPSALVQVPT